jgi:hypothetical protein
MVPRNIFTIVAAFGLISAPAFAQGNPTGSEQAKPTKTVKKAKKKTPGRQVKRTGTGTEGSGGFFPAVGPILGVVASAGAAGAALQLAKSNSNNISPD